MIKNLIIEGIDRLGKDSLISNIQHELGFFQVIHYEKPKLLDIYYRDSIKKLNGFNPDDPLLKEKSIVANALMNYQTDSFKEMFELLGSRSKLIMNRAHLGEWVYSLRYRNYSGTYVFGMEKEFQEAGNKFADNTLLVLLTTTDFGFIKDDGLSLDFNKKEEEQKDFLLGFHRSVIKNKLLIDVSNGKGGYRSYGQILDQVVSGFKYGTGRTIL